MIPTRNRKKTLQVTVEEMRNFAFVYIEKYAPSKQQLRTYLLKKYCNKGKYDSSYGICYPKLYVKYLREYFEKLGLDENIIAKALTIFNKFNYPNMKYEAQKVFYNDYNNSINCADAMYISKCKLNILRKLHINHNFDTDFILVINEINKKLLFNDKSLNNSIIPKFYLE